jgi:hypothetical protein
MNERFMQWYDSRGRAHSRTVPAGQVARESVLLRTHGCTISRISRVG